MFSHLWAAILQILQFKSERKRMEGMQSKLRFRSAYEIHIHYKASRRTIMQSDQSGINGIQQEI
jgi:hypothetical protein